MNILLTAATGAEIAPLIKLIHSGKDVPYNGIYTYGNHTITICITGVGVVATAYYLTRALRQAKYDLVIQAGIAGSFNPKLSIGEVVVIESDIIADMGAEDHDVFISIFDLGLADRNIHPYSNGVLKMSPLTIKMPVLKKVSALTVNTVSGSSKTIDILKERCNCDIESMEGAAFHFICQMEHVQFIQIRAVSNYVEPRDKSKWNIPVALQNLNAALFELLQLND